MVEAARKVGCPLLIGSSGMAGGNRNLDRMIEIAKEVFSEFNIQDAKVAVIRSELDPEIVVRECRAGALLPTGPGPELSEETLRESVIVGQMGVHPLITALESGGPIRLRWPLLRQRVVCRRYDPPGHRRGTCLSRRSHPGIRGTGLRTRLPIGLSYRRNLR